MRLSPLLWAGALVAASPAVAQNMCGQRENVVSMLWERWGERQVASGLIDESSLIEFFASRDGSWTAVVTSSSGVSCIKAAGRNWLVDCNAKSKVKPVN